MIKSSICFGMVYIPVKIEVAVDEKEISFNQLEKNTLSRVRYQKTCDMCGGKVVENKDIVKAYQYQKDRYVVLTDEDFESIKTKKDKSINIEQFVDLKEIDPIFFDKPYYVVPTDAIKAYNLLIESMAGLKKVAIARAVLGQKERLIALRVNNGRLLLSTLFFNSQIRENPAPKAKKESLKVEREMADMIVKNMSKPFNPNDYHDEYSKKVLKAIDAKIAGKEIAVPLESATQLTDLMEALKQSLQLTNSSKNGNSNDSDNPTSAT